MVYALVPVAVVGFIAAVVAAQMPWREGRAIRLHPLIFEVPAWHARATNFRTHIVIKRGIDEPGPTLCEEYAELGYKWRHPWGSYRGKPDFKRDLEWWGNAVQIEALVSMGKDRGEAMEREVRRLRQYAQFAGWSDEDITAGIRQHRVPARRWIDKHAGFVKWAMNYGR